MLFLCGRYDPLALPKRIEKVITKLKDAKLIIFEESGHDPFVDEPERFTQVVLGFTNRLSTKRVY
jgi:pimeloyl-ACP methyl ester carboxylesterase